MKKKVKHLLLIEAVLFLLIFSGVFYCQYFVGFNTLWGAVKVALSFCLPLFLFGFCYGIGVLYRAAFFNGDYESPLKDNDKKGEPPARVYGVLNQL